MAMFVHLTSERNARVVLRSGITRLRKAGIRPAGFFAMPVTRHFYVSHQWLRELKRGGQRTICGVYFRIPDDEVVWVGHYNANHLAMTADEAAAVMLASESREGYEVIIPRKVASSEIHRVRHLPQVIGWRYRPGSHKRSLCLCVICNPPGSINSHKKRSAWELRQSRGPSSS